MAMSPKTQQDGGESVYSSRSSSLSKASRKARRDRDRDRTDKKKEAIEAGPSGTSHSDAVTEAGPSTTLNKRQDVASSSFAADQDFVGFTFSDDEKENEEEVEETAPPVREWDRGKGKARDYEGTGRKRRRDEIDYNDGYANKKQRLDAASRLAPWAVDVEWDKCTNVAEMLHQEVEAFVKYISPTPVEDEVRSLIVASISRAVTGAVSDAKVFPFGSYETKLYLPLGDIDLVVESDRMAYSNKTHVLQKLAAAVKHAGITDKVTIIAKAKVPIIKFITRHGRFSVDMSINQMNGVKAGTMVKGFLDHLPALRALVLITKSFLSQRSMNEVFTGGLGSYSIVCLAISFLQMHPKIRRGEIDPSKNLGVLVMEFFELYGFYFNYNEVGISVRDGGSYYNKSQRGWSDHRSPGLLSVEDPGDPANDISRGSYGIAKVRATLAGAHGIMTAAAYAQAGIINSRRSGRHGKLKRETNPEEMSILASVMGVTMETINHRKVVQEVYDTRVLHRLLGVDPRPTVTVSSEPKLPRKSSCRRESRAAKESVQSAWQHEDADHESVHEPEAEPEVEESRYRIDKRQPPRKRRRVDAEIDMHAVYTVDEDDEDEDKAGSGPEGELLVHTVEASDPDTDKEEAEYDTPASRLDKSSRRSYWLSKGIESAVDALSHD